MAHRKGRRWLVAAGIGASFLSILALVGWLAAEQIVTPQMAVLLGIATFGLYVGFGILITVYRMISRLE
ncbi:MAG: hypothetical protein OXJ53_19505 [Gammaproteobacteria bacterium]|nr:hypothetical protein [Gammaproteobacteria bacterium]MDE0273448.1 hypothetical protein [Gammaproteobacteria bacterium]